MFQWQRLRISMIEFEGSLWHESHWIHANDGYWWIVIDSQVYWNWWSLSIEWTGLSYWVYFWCYWSIVMCGDFWSTTDMSYYIELPCGLRWDRHNRDFYMQQSLFFVWYWEYSCSSTEMCVAHKMGMTMVDCVSEHLVVSEIMRMMEYYAWTVILLTSEVLGFLLPYELLSVFAEHWNLTLTLWKILLLNW